MSKWIVVAAAPVLSLAMACVRTNPEFSGGTEGGTSGDGSTSSSKPPSSGPGPTGETRAGDEGEAGGMTAPPLDTGLPTSDADTSTTSGDGSTDTSETGNEDTVGGSTGVQLCPEPAGDVGAFMYVAGEYGGNFAGHDGPTGIARARTACTEAMPGDCAAAFPMLVDPTAGDLDVVDAPEKPLGEVVNPDESCLMADSVDDLLDSGLITSLEFGLDIDTDVWSGISDALEIATCSEWSQAGDVQTAYLGAFDEIGLYFLSKGEAQPCNVDRPLVCLCWSDVN